MWAILLLVLLEDFGIPVPGETVLIAGAVFAGSGRLNIVAVGVVGFAAAVLGDNIGYAIGRFGGRALVDRWGRYVFLTPERVDKAEAFFNRHGGKIIVFARFIEGLRQANGIIAGISGMHWLRFLAFNALGAALWVGTWVSVGYFAGQHITTIYDGITRYALYAADRRGGTDRRLDRLPPAQAPPAGASRHGASRPTEDADKPADAADAADAADNATDNAQRGATADPSRRPPAPLGRPREPSPNPRSRREENSRSPRCTPVPRCQLTPVSPLAARGPGLAG